MNENVPVKAGFAIQKFVIRLLADPSAGRSFQLSAYLNQPFAPVPTSPSASQLRTLL